MATQEPRDSKDTRSTTTEVRPHDKPTRDVRRAEDANRRDALRSWSDPLDVLRRFADRLDRWPLAPFWTGESPGRRRGIAGAWAPQIESFQRGDQFIVRADLPGLAKDDVRVDVEDDALVITGERTIKEEHDADGYYTSERSYGRFCRVVPLPEGAIHDSAKAAFRNGVLEVTMQAPPPEATPRGRRVEITDVGSR
jgi:HSP20 family protein